MYVRRKTTNKTNDDSRQRDIHGSCAAAGGEAGARIATTSKLFQPGAKIIVHRAPLLNGLSCPTTGLQKKFQRPMLKRRAYNRDADDALRRSSLGPKKRMDGMAKLMARAGRGLSFQLAQKPKNDDDDSDGDNTDDEDDDDPSETERPFEPLRVWHSPHQGGEAIGLPATVYVVCLLEIVHEFVFAIFYLLGCCRLILLVVVWSDSLL